MTNFIITEKEEQERIWEIRHQIAIERFASFDEYMDIPGYNSEEELESVEDKMYQVNLEKRLEACKLRYQGMEEYMEIPDMDLWLKLKEEIIIKTERQEVSMAMNSNDYDNYSMDSIDKQELRYLRFKDECLDGRRSDSF